MARREFDITAVLGQQVSKLDSGAAVQQIPFDLLIPNPQNEKLSMPAIEEMADDIEFHGGILEPLLVKPDGDNYMVLSGHRRRAGGELLRKRRPDLLATVPCIVLHPTSEAEETMIMISANKQRPKTDADLMDELERTRTALVALRKQGMEMPGKLRDMQAEALKISASKVARLDVIRKGLISYVDGQPAFMIQFRAEKLPESTAYALARMTPYQQEIVFDATKKKGISKETAEDLLERMSYIVDPKRKCPDGTPCTNSERMLRESCKKDRSWEMCDGCCLTCSQRRSCARPCPKAKDEIEHERERDRKSKDKQDREQKKREQDARKGNKALACRILVAAKRNGCDLSKLREANPNWSLDRLQKNAVGEDLSSYANAYLPYYASEYKRIVDFLGCTVDYLMGFSETPQPAPSVWRNAAQELPPEGTFVFACDEFGAVAHSVFFGGRFMDAGLKSVGNTELPHIAWWMYSPELPDGLRRMGEEIINKMTAVKEDKK